MKPYPYITSSILVKYEGLLGESHHVCLIHLSILVREELLVRMELILGILQLSKRSAWFYMCRNSLQFVGTAMSDLTSSKQ